MTITEFSDQFDVLYNNITSNQAPGLNEYEKSIFLTKAQEELVKNYFSPKGNPKMDGFDDSPKRQADFSSIIKSNSLVHTSHDGFDKRTTTLTYYLPSDLFISLNEQLMDGNTPITVVPISYTEYDRLMSKPYKYPPKYQAWRLINTKIGSSGQIVTVTQTLGTAELTLTLSSNYGMPIRFIVNTTSGNSQAPSITSTTNLVTIVCTVGNDMTKLQNYFTQQYRSDLMPYFVWDQCSWPVADINNDLINEQNVFDLTVPTDSGTSSKVAEIIGRFTTSVPNYSMRYIKRPSPIILVNLSDNIQNGLTIQGQHGPCTSELSEELHEEILQRAVELAKVAWTATGQENTQLVIEAGKRSE